MVLIRLDRTPEVIPLMGERGKDYCWTLNNYTDDEVMELRTLGLHPDVQYIVFGYEVGEECGTPHLQGYICFKSKKRIGAARKMMPKRIAKFALRIKTHQEARDYCKKDGNYEEMGTDPHPGNGKAKRADADVDYDSIIEAFRDGKTLKEVVELFPEQGVKHFHCLKGIESVFKAPFSLTRYEGPFPSHFPYDWDRTKTLVLIGEPGICKTQWALNQFSNPFFCRNVNKLRAFDHRIHDGIVIDDLENELSRSNQLNLLEVEQACTIRVLYGTVDIPAWIPRILCCNPDKIPIDLTDGAIKRRCHVERIINWF